ncbi:MAG: hypothetical protein M3N43_07120 [Actinomycetota bacterium]|nr:hypothetical protein [Actinomycetota bacterium]
MDRLVELKADFEILGTVLVTAEGSEAAAIARERRLIGAEIERLEKSEGGSFFDELAVVRAAAGVDRPPARRRKSG